MTAASNQIPGLESFLRALAHAGMEVEKQPPPSCTTFPWPSRALARVRPATRDEAALVATLAGTHGCPIFPVSRGRNWGLGSAQPIRDAVLVDLSRLDRILDIDMSNGTARIEPGVTFTQLQRALADQGLAHHLPSFGGPTDASVLANALERGEGAGVAGDRFGALFDLEVALSTGDRIRTGHARHGEHAVAALHARPAGPLLDGLFSQSSLGLVLSARVTLAPTLQWNQGVMYEFDRREDLATAVPILRDLVRTGICYPHDVVLWNRAKRVSSIERGIAAVTEAMAAPGMCWGISIIASAEHRELLDVRLAILDRELAPVAARTVSASDRAEDGTRLETHLTGFSHGGNLVSAYAAMPTVGPEPLDPDRDGCGLLWLCPVAPFEALAILDIEAMIAAATRGLPMFGALGLQAVSPRALHAYVSIAWDRHDEAADGAALKMHDRLTADLQRAGYLPFRLGHPAIAAAASEAPYAAVLSRVAAALDPGAVMAPGKVQRQ